MKVKICANTSIEEARMCIDAGADIIGILVGQEHVSKDFPGESGCGGFARARRV